MLDYDGVNEMRDFLFAAKEKIDACRGIPNLGKVPTALSRLAIGDLLQLARCTLLTKQTSQRFSKV